MKPKFYMLVGLPGSGKSTIAKSLALEKDTKIFSSDELRKELWGNENTQGDNNELFNELHNRIIKSLKSNENCVYDATNINSKKRTQFLNTIKDIDCKKICIIVATDINVCLQRNNSRERKAPYEVIKKMYTSFQTPQYREGWDNITIYRTRDENNDYDIYKFIDYLEAQNHDNPHHLLTIGGHIQAVTKYIMDNYTLKLAGDFDRFYNILNAAMHHDIGKGFTKSFINSKGESTEVAHYYGHENVSAYMYLLYENKDKIENDTRNILYVADLIQLHMRMHCHNESKEKVHQKIKKIVGQKEFEDLCILNEADTICA